MEDMAETTTWVMWIIFGIFGPVGIISGVEIVRFFLGKSTKLKFLIALVVLAICLYFVGGVLYVADLVEKAAMP